jgi:GT2 family glycosyltransferase
VTAASTSTPVRPAMTGAASGWSGAVWVGTVDDVELAAGRQHLVGLEGYSRARLLVRTGRFPRGFVELDLADGTVDRGLLRQAFDALPGPTTPPPDPSRPPVSVVVCTYDRPAMLRDALTSLTALDYPDFEVVVVDNHPESGATRPVVDALADPRVRLVAEPRRGLAVARNTGAISAAHDLVAFTDDDVVVDRWWLAGIADGFARAPGVACVSGIVATGEIGSASQAYFDRRVSWARSCRPEVFCLARPPAADPLFPFQVSRFGTGANFALRRTDLLALGGFDEGLGVGSPAAGGEDIDMFVRVLLAGRSLAYEPCALVWHRHRSDPGTLERQIVDYGTGLGAWLTKTALRPRTAGMVLRRTRAGYRHLRTVTQVDTPTVATLPEHRDLWRVERRAVLTGPLALARSRLRGATSRPLAGRGGPRNTRSRGET